MKLRFVLSVRARELGIATVAVYSTADKEALHTLLADEAVCIGPGKPTESYLNINAVLSAAVLTEAEAIHPGFGFLSENSKFATMCEEVGIKFIGPSGHVMDMMGDKLDTNFFTHGCKFGIFTEKSKTWVNGFCLSQDCS